MKLKQYIKNLEALAQLILKQVHYLHPEDHKEDAELIAALKTLKLTTSCCQSCRRRLKGK